MKRRSTMFRLAAAATVGVLTLTACGGGDDDSSDDGSSSGDSSSDAAVQEGDGTLTIGSLLPETGSLSFLGPPEFAGVDLAVQEINEAGGVLGQDVVHVRGDSGDTDSGIAPAESDQLIASGADVIVGAASSGVSMTVIDQILDAGVVMFSPANTSTDFDEGAYAEPDLYFRTAPSDILQGAVMANLLIEDGRSNVSILARQDAYGQTLADQVQTNLENAGSSVATTVFYGENAQSYDSQVEEIAAAGGDAVLVIGFEETATIIPQLITAGAGPADVPTYFVDGNTADYSADSDPSLPPGTLEGTKGTIPGADTAGDFQERLLAIDPDLTSFAYAAESYDAVIVSALAAVAAGNDSGEAIAQEIVNVTKDGTKCTSFAECLELLEAGEDIDYDGASGPIELGETGSPTAASIGIYEYDAENRNSPIDYIEGEI
ncbi:ABC transporter substrate-binding protein [Nocardioides zeae]|uniref:ABC transporter substrate-binding protein n=1 Tax=Nocardioides imazamoxiresistens TaxID=3231893 RepID=A0ABU3PZ48_9ACTN|nr:ABC transporter substrate-binding protein [Nocardioides zeae]MDT9594548.1 ABC transporter substrate-binding protein [Nocardioides zeae]